MKKIIVGLSAIAIIIGGVATMSAFEAHVINVTAQIENALSVATEHIVFGTVFPNERLERGLEIGLSSSFLEEDRVDDVEYKIVQKPKPVNPDNPDYDTDYCIEEKAMLYGCINTYLVDNPGSTLQEAIMDCYEGYDIENCYPSLCQFLSKEPDDDPANDYGIGALHQIAQCMDGIDNDQDGYI